MAWLGVALVLLLTLASASPAAHRLLHAHETGHPVAETGTHAVPPASDSEHGCAVVLYASGTTVPLAEIALPAAVARPLEFSQVGISAALPPSPRWLLPPESGPPVRSLG